MAVDDPCISVCRFGGSAGWCAGCGRTLAEVRAWRKLRPHARGQVERDLPRRMRKIAERAAREPASE